MNNPYAQMKDHQMWRRAMSRVETHLVDPVVAPKFKIDHATRISTAGSCFAQHIARKIAEIGFHYYVPESGDGLDEATRRRRNFGVFSARYGNLYTTHQLLQLFEEAFEGRAPVETAWARADGRFVDPYRPQIEPDGFADAAAVAAARREHLDHVRSAFRDADVLIFTLGLTESWRNKQDGFVFPLAPGVVGGSFDPAIHEFVNFDVSDVADALERFLEKLKVVNPQIRVLLTVSPVPLIATYEERHVLVSTTYSKSVLRVAAEMSARKRAWVDYFPSYEIITGSYAGGLYYEDDHREVRPIGVAHAMRCFVANYVEGAVKTVVTPAAAGVSNSAAEDREILCDEEAIDMIRA